MVNASVSELHLQTNQKNGVLKAAVGLAISPVYYSAVAIGGGSAYEAAQARIPR